jgi:hypothetical protein
LSTASCTSTPRPASCGRVWPPRSATYPREQRVPPGVLLNHRGCRRQRGRTHLRGVPVLRPHD